MTSRRGPLRRRRREIDPADDDREHVVEVVRDAAGQLADGFHFLDLTKLRLGGLALGRFGLQGLVRFPQLLRALAHRHAPALRRVRLRFDSAPRGSVLAQRLHRDDTEEHARRGRRGRRASSDNR